MVVDTSAAAAAGGGSSLSSAAMDTDKTKPQGVPAEPRDTVMTQARPIDQATPEQQADLIQNVMKKLSNRPPVGQTPLFQKEAVKRIDITSASLLFDGAKQAYNDAKANGFTTVDWSIPFKIQTQQLLFYLWARRFAMTYAQFWAPDKEVTSPDGYEFGSASGRLRMARSLFAQQVATWDVLIANDAGKYIDRLLTGAQGGDQQVATVFETFLLAITRAEKAGGEDTSPSLDVIDEASQERKDEKERLEEKIVALETEKERLEKQNADLDTDIFGLDDRISNEQAARIRNSVNDMDLSFFMKPNEKMGEFVSTLKTALDELEELKRWNQRNEAVTSGQKEKMDDLERRLKDANKSRVAMSVNNTDLSLFMGPNETMNTLIEALDKAQKDLAALSGDEKSREAAVGSQTKKMDDLERRLRDAVNARVAMSVNNTDLSLFMGPNETMNTLIEDLNEARQRLATLSSDEKSREAAVGSQTKKIEDLEKSLKDAVNARVAMSVNDIDLSLFMEPNQTIEDLQRRTKELEESLDKAKARVQSSSVSRSELTSKITTLEEKLTSMRISLEDAYRRLIQNSLNDIDLSLFMEPNQTIEDLQRQIKELAQQKQSMDSQINQLKDTLRDTRAAADLEKAKVVATKAEIDKLKSEMAQKEEEIPRLNEEIRAKEAATQRRNTALMNVYRIAPSLSWNTTDVTNMLKDDSKLPEVVAHIKARFDSLVQEKNLRDSIISKLIGLQGVTGFPSNKGATKMLDWLIAEAKKECEASTSLRNENAILTQKIETKDAQIERLNNTLQQTKGQESETVRNLKARLDEQERARVAALTTSEEATRLLKKQLEDSMRKNIQNSLMCDDVIGLLNTRYGGLTMPAFFGKERG